MRLIRLKDKELEFILGFISESRNSIPNPKTRDALSLISKRIQRQINDGKLITDLKEFFNGRKILRKKD